MRLSCQSTKSVKLGRTYGRQSLPLIRGASKKPDDARLRRHDECHTPSLQLGVRRKRRTSVRNSSSLVYCVPNKRVKLEQSPSHNSDTEIELDLPLQSNSGCESEDRDPLAMSPAKKTARVTSTPDENIVLQSSENLVTDLLSTPEDRKMSLGSDGEYDRKCESIKKNLFGASPPYDFRAPRVVKPNSNKKQTPINEKSPTISQQGSFSYDSYMNMLSDVGKPGFESPKFHSEPIETINEYPSLNRSMGNNGAITGELESCVVNENKQNQLKCVVDKPVTVTRRKGGRPQKTQPTITKTPAKKETPARTKTPGRACARVTRQNSQCTSGEDNGVDDETYSNCRQSNRVKTPVRKSTRVAQKNSQCTADGDDDGGTYKNRRSTNRASQRKNLEIKPVASNNSERYESSDEIHSINHEKSDSDSDSDSSYILSETDAAYIDIEAEVADSLFIDNRIIEEVSRLQVMPDEDVAPQHLLDCFLKSTTTSKMNEGCVRYTSIKQGKFSAEEAETIKSNWLRFCKIHDWDPAVAAPFLQMQFRGKFLMPRREDRLNFVRYLAKGLPSRTLYSVLRHFKVIFRLGSSSPKRVRFSPIEDQKILAYLSDGDSKDRYRKLSLILKRSRRSIRKRFRFLTKKAKGNMPKGNVEWNLEISQRFVTNLMEITLTKDIRDLEDQFIPKIVWIELEKRLGIPHRNLHDFWYKQMHLQLYCPWPIYDNDLKIMLIEYMYVRGITQREELSWIKVAKHFPGLTSVYLYSLYVRIIKSSPFGNSTCAADIGDMIEWMYTLQIPNIIASPNDRYLPRLQYENGKLVVLDD